MSFSERLAAAVRRRRQSRRRGARSTLRPIAGDTAIGRRDGPSNRRRAFRQFCCEIIDVVAHRVPAVKPQMAFFEELGPAGMVALAAVIQHARRAGLLVILDGKRNDIGSTATAYAQAYLGPSSAWQADALTVSPYLGDDSLTPFVDAARAESAGRVCVGQDFESGRAYVSRSVGRGAARLSSRGAAGRTIGRGNRRPQWLR